MIDDIGTGGLRFDSPAGQIGCSVSNMHLRCDIFLRNFLSVLPVRKVAEMGLSSANLFYASAYPRDCNVDLC